MAKKSKQATAAFDSLEVQNAAKTLFANIRFSAIDNDIKTICVTSAVPNEGKTTTAIALATAIATSGKSTLLVEADMRRRSLAKCLRVNPKGGAYSVITKMANTVDVLCATSTPNLFFLDIEPSIPNPADILSSKRYAALIDALKEKFDYIIFDTPPLATFVDAAIIASSVDGTLLVVKRGSTKREVALSAIKQLRQANAHLLGAVLTFEENQGSEYYYTYYTQDTTNDVSTSWGRKK